MKAAQDKSIEIFAGIVRSAPYGRYTARAQFNIGRLRRSRERRGRGAAYQAVVEKFPDDPLAADAQYQIGYLWLKTTKSGVRGCEGHDECAHRLPGFPLSLSEEREDCAGERKSAG